MLKFFRVPYYFNRLSVEKCKEAWSIRSYIKTRENLYYAFLHNKKKEAITKGERAPVNIDCSLRRNHLSR